MDATHRGWLRLLEWLLDLDEIRIGRDSPLLLEWHSPYRGWLILGLSLIALLLVSWAYRRETGSLRKRIVLGAIRLSLAGLLLVILCEPALVLQRNRVEPSFVAVLVDQSQSMGRVDVPAAGTSRLDVVKQAFDGGGGAGFGQLLANNDVRLYSFDASARREAEARSTDSIADLTDSLEGLSGTGGQTDVAAAVERVMEDARGGRLAGIVLVSDGQATSRDRLAEVASAADRRGVAIHVLPVGSDEPVLDLSIEAVVAEDHVFLHDLISVRATVRCDALLSTETVNVHLMDESSGAEAAEGAVTLGPDQASADIELRTKPSRRGRLRYRIVADAVEGERDLSNNEAVIEVAVADERLRVLYVEGYPRYEYRYLKNALIREETCRLSVLLLEADEDFAQEGSDPIRRFPETEEELNEFDLVLFGDVDPTGHWLSAHQQQMLVDFVGRRGGGFGLIAGERAAPQRFAGTALERLIPVRIDPDFHGSYTETLSASYEPVLTPAGSRSRIFLMTDRGEEGSFFDGLPGMYWLARTLGPKPGAETLVIHPTLSTPDGPMPVLVMGRYGAGKTLFQATDDTWRWRRHTGEFLHDTYWIQLVRSLMPSKAGGLDRRFALRLSKSKTALGEAVDVQVELRDPVLLSLAGDNLHVVVVDDSDAPSARVALDRIGQSSDVFEGRFVPPGVGLYRLKVEEVPPLPGQGVYETRLQVEQAGAEQSRLEADPALLHRLARQTGGMVFDMADDWPAVLGRIPNRSVRIPDDLTEPLWDTKLAIGLFVMLLSSEWILRKWWGMS